MKCTVLKHKYGYYYYGYYGYNMVSHRYHTQSWPVHTALCILAEL